MERPGGRFKVEACQYNVILRAAEQGILRHESSPNGSAWKESWKGTQPKAPALLDEETECVQR
jgi:hypothetical protein